VNPYDLSAFDLREQAAAAVLAERERIARMFEQLADEKDRKNRRPITLSPWGDHVPWGAVVDLKTRTMLGPKASAAVSRLRRFARAVRAGRETL
jgi:hypothetical protein